MGRGQTYTWKGLKMVFGLIFWLDRREFYLRIPSPGFCKSHLIGYMIIYPVTMGELSREQTRTGAA